MKREYALKKIEEILVENCDSKYLDYPAIKVSDLILTKLEDIGMQPPRDAVLLRNEWTHSENK